MFVELAKACLPETQYSAFEKTEPSSALKKYLFFLIYANNF